MEAAEAAVFSSEKGRCSGFLYQMLSASGPTLSDYRWRLPFSVSLLAAHPNPHIVKHWVLAVAGLRVVLVWLEEHRSDQPFLWLNPDKGFL